MNPKLLATDALTSFSNLAPDAQILVIKKMSTQTADFIEMLISSNIDKKTPCKAKRARPVAKYSPSNESPEPDRKAHAEHAEEIWTGGVTYIFSENERAMLSEFLKRHHSAKCLMPGNAAIAAIRFALSNPKQFMAWSSMMERYETNEGVDQEEMIDKKIGLLAKQLKNQKL